MSQETKHSEETSVTPYPGDPGRLFPAVADWSALVVECEWIDYSASRVARAVEDCDAHLLNLNVTSANSLPDRTIVEIRTDHRNPESIARSLERYGYRVTAMTSSASDDDADTSADTARRRLGELLRYLEI